MSFLEFSAYRQFFTLLGNFVTIVFFSSLLHCNEISSSESECQCVYESMCISKRVREEKSSGKIEREREKEREMMMMMANKRDEQMWKN